MMGEIYGQLLQDLLSGNRNSPIFLHHIDYINHVHYHRETPYALTEPNQIVVDYIASMTDDYFIDLFSYLFPKSNQKIQYRGYFDEERSKS
jgi:dGTPase